MPRRVITLTTDFGLADHFVGVMKGVILGINPEVELVDISHEVSSHDVLDGAFTLAASCRYFPAGTIHLVVVDPGVGSARRPILARAPAAWFVAPDNGVLSPFYEREGAEVRHITSIRYFLQPISNTFHGRDVFSPVAAWLSKGIAPEEFGSVISDYVRVGLPRPRRLSERTLQGEVLKVDKFGNVITNFAASDAAEIFGEAAKAFRITVHQREIRVLHTDYASPTPGEIFAILGSTGYIELAAREESAAKLLNVGRGAAVSLELE